MVYTAALKPIPFRIKEEEEEEGKEEWSGSFGALEGRSGFFLIQTTCFLL